MQKKTHGVKKRGEEEEEEKDDDDEEEEEEEEGRRNHKFTLKPSAIILCHSSFTPSHSTVKILASDSIDIFTHLFYQIKSILTNTQNSFTLTSSRALSTLNMLRRKPVIFVHKRVW